MPTPNPTLRREYKGAAAATSLSSGMANADTTFVLVANTNWPTGAVGNFIVTINRGFADEEKILCSSQAARTVTVATSGRGFDGTTAQLHAAGATVECTLSAFDADEWNQHTAASTGVHGVTTVAGLTETQTLTNKTLTSPAINGGVSDASSTIAGISGTTLAAERGAWTTYTPASFGNCTSPVGSFAYMLMGKTLFLRGAFTAGTVTANSGISFSLPSSLLAKAAQSVTWANIAVTATYTGAIASGSASVLLLQSLTAGSNLNGFSASAVLEVQ